MLLKPVVEGKNKMPRTAALTNSPKTANMAGVQTLLYGCIEILRGVAEMFPTHGNRNLTAPVETANRGPGRPKNWKIEPGGKAKAA